MREHWAQTQSNRFLRGTSRTAAAAFSLIAAFTAEFVEGQITSYNSSKTALYQQYSEKEVSSTGFEFSAGVSGEKEISDIAAPSLTAPDERTLKLELVSPQLWSFQSHYEQSDGLEKEFPSGTYRWNLMEREPIALLLGGPEPGYPLDTPRVTGGLWEAGSLCLVSDEDSVIHFSEFTSFSKGNRITLSLSDGKRTLLSQTYLSSMEKETPSTFTLGAKTLVNGQSYTFSIRFESIVDANTEAIPGAEGTSTLANQTTINILAVPEPSIMALLGSGSFILLAIRSRRTPPKASTSRPLSS